MAQGTAHGPSGRPEGTAGHRAKIVPDLCRLRAVCRSWRALTYDPHFAAVHKSRHAEPLFAVTFRDRFGYGIAIVGLSGQVLRRIPFGTDHIELLLTHLDRLCVIRGCKPSLAAWVLNPATGVALTLPGLHSDEFVGICIEDRFSWGSLRHKCKTVTYALGQVAATGDYKVLRISHPDRSQPLLCDINTLDGSSQGTWRRKQNPPSNLKRPSNLMRDENMECLAVNGAVYFFFDYDLMEPTSLATFDLDTEKWMPTLRGPEPLRSAKFGYERVLSLANLNGSLVLVDKDFGVSNFDLWFLVDHKRGLWVKKYRLSNNLFDYLVHPLLILDDGRVVIFEVVERLLQCYDPRTGNFADVLDIGAMRLAETQSIGVYTGNLLI
ncbi:hypothetical protein BDA96_05G045900 [Sorghum bicolor]|uniref:F-box associated beta-propeller type 3 domain-containing protein n=1 Tax=Sorghum bicolor TaxID=4558 RepID=A0A921UF89_SORBI|nr:hypothetical protein BDA96_05G045900 [Sorghum bicolor]